MNFSVRRAVPLASALLLSACDSGGGNGSGGGSTPTPTPAATLNVTLTPGARDVTITDDDTGQTLGFSAAVSGTTSDTVVPIFSMTRRSSPCRES